MDRNTLVRNLAMLLEALAVPVSLEMRLGAATGAWTAVHRELAGFGWATADDYERALREKLGMEALPS